MMEHARIRVQEAEQEDANYVSTWWGGYHRALEDVLAMEDANYVSTWWGGYHRALEDVLAMENE